MNDKFFGESYLNKYDAAYDKYKTNKNFDLKMWQEAFDRGEQDSYLAFLEHNKDTTFSNQFYDQKYYDYEGKMLEMYKPLADNTKTSMQKKQVFDAESNKWVEEDIGEMTEQQYVQYQLDKLYAEKTYEMENQILQDRREKVKWYEKVGHDVLAASGEALEGAVTGVLGVFDFIFAPFVATADAMEGANWLDAYTDYFAEGLTQIEKDTFRTELDKYERTYTHLYDDKGNQTGFGKYVGGIYNSIGRMIPAIVLNAALPGIGQAAFYTGIFSSNMNDNAINPEVAGSPSLLKVANASIKTATELVIEQALGKFLGGTIQNKLLGIVGASSTKGFKGLTKLTGWQYVLKSAAQEGLEEFCQDFSTNLIDQFTDMIYEGYGNTGVTFQTLIDSFIIGALSSIVMSGGQVVIDRVITNAKNRALEKSTGIKDAAELYIETEKVRGFNKLYLKSVISDFKSDLEKLKKTKDVGLAKQLYSTLTVMSELYSTFSKERLVNAEKLLDRVIAADEAKPIIVDTSLSDKVKEERTRNKLTDKLMPTLPGTDTDTSLARKYEGKLAKEIIKEERTRNKLMPTLPGTDTSEAKAIATDLLVENLSKDIDDMLAVKNRELTEKIKTVIKKHKEKLKEANVTEVKAVVDEKGVTHKKIKLQEKKVDPVIKKLEKQEDTLAYFKKIFKTITIVDGNIVIRDEDMLFVSESWLQNYEKSEIYQFLEQENILETLIGDDIFNTFLDDLLKFDKKFTKRKGTVTKKTALMDLLFNKSVYQAFLLTKVNKVQGGRAFAYKDFIFKLHDIINRLLKNATNKQAVSEVYNKIKASMREGTLKAILNWNIDPQTIGADSVLTDADRVEVNKYLARKNLMKQQGKISAEYKNLVPDIIANGNYSKEEKELINKGLEPNANNHDRLIALGLLSLGDDRIDGFGFTYTAKKHAQNQERSLQLIDNIINEKPKIDRDGNSYLSFDNVDELYRLIKTFYRAANLSSEDRITLNKIFSEFGNKSLLYTFDALFERIRTNENNFRDTLINIIKRSTTFNASITKNKRTITLPIEAFGDINDSDVEIQHKADKLIEFKKRYGISAKQLLLGDITGMTLEQAELIEQEMQVLNVDNYVSFVQYKLEKMLGEDYIVIPVYENEIATGFKITKTMDVSNILSIPQNDNIVFEDCFKKLDTPKVQYLYYNKYTINYAPLQLSTILNVNIDPEWQVILVEPGDNSISLTDTSAKRIVLTRDAYLFNSFVHELNHVIQSEFNLPTGGDSSTLTAFPEYLKYVWANYRPLIQYRAKYMALEVSLDAKFFNRKRVDFNKLPYDVLSCLHYVAYRLLHGELLAELSTNNIKARGFVITDGESITSPEGSIFYKRDDILPGDVTIISKYKRPTDYLIEHGNFTKEEQDLIDKGLLDNASTYDILVSTMLLNLADRLVANDYSGIERSILKALNNIVNETDMSKLIGFLNILVELELLTDKEVSEININDRQAILELFNKVDVTQLSTNKSKQGGPRIFKLPAKYASELNKDIRLYELAENAYNKYTQLINNILNAPKASEILYRTQFIMSLQLLYTTNFFEISNTKKNEARKIVEHIEKNKTTFVNYVKTNKASIIKLFESAKLKPLMSILGHSTVFNEEVLKRKEDAIKKFEKEYHVSIEDVIEGKVKIKGAGNQAIFVQKELEKTLGKGFSIAFDMWTQEIIVIKDFTAEQIVKDPIDTNLDLDTINRRFVKGAIKVKAGEKGLGGDIEEFNTLEIKLSDLVKEEISNEMPGWVVKLHNADKDYTALEDYSTKTIYIKTIKDMNWYDAFLHELNHAIQETYNLPVGSSPERVMNSPEYLRHVWNNYKPLVKYIFRNSNIKFDVNKKFDELPEKALDRLSDLAYMMIQGEIDAEFFAHNKQTRGFVDEGTRITDPVGGEFFPVDNTSQLPKVSAKATPDTYIENSMAREFMSIYDSRKAFDITKTRNTYHTKLSVKSSDEIIDKLIDKSVIIPPNINDIITNPEAYLSKEMLSKLKGDLSEGNVFYKLKEYVENTFDSISIDRDRDTHQYLLVDDNAIDDFLTPTMRENAQDTKGTNLVEAYNGKTVGLSNFYSLKFEYDIKVKVGNDVNTQIDINHRNKSVVISINTNNRTNAQFIDALNHEFRHLMQEFNGLESGFSADIEVSPEMLADIKKHVPEIFKNKTLIEDAKLAGRTDTDVFIAQRFIYFLVGGEKNAYGFKADMLNTKPIYVTYEGDKFTIFMPWYDIKTGDGRYKTTYANARKDDIKYGIPQIKKKPKGKKTVTKDGKVKYLYKNERWVTKKQAGDTNLKHFFKEGENYIQMDTDLQEFVKATTGNDEKIDKVVMNAIKKGILTKTNLFKYFRNAPTINDYTFTLINEHLFKNKAITNMSELTNLTENDGVAIYWAIAMILRRENISPEFLTAQKNLTDFNELDKYLQTTKYYKDIEKLVKKFNLYKTDKGFREFVLTPDMQRYLRVFVMKYFDGTLAGAFYMANAFRKYVKLISIELEQREVAMDASFDATGKGESEVTIGDTLQNKDLEATVRNTYDNDIGDDIEAFYDLENRMAELTENDILKMQQEILQTKYVAEIDELLDKTKLSADVKKVIKGWLLDTDPSSSHNTLYKAIEKQKAEGKSTKLLQNILDNAILIVEKNEDWADNELAVMSVDEITKRYNLITDAQMIKTEIPKDVIVEKSTKLGDSRIKIVNTIKLKASQLINLIQKGEVPFKSLPDEIQAMFELKTSKKIKHYVLKPEVYSVGRGRATLPGGPSLGRNLYQGKKDLNKEQSYKHDVTEIIENRDKLISTVKLAKEYAKNKDKAIKTGFKTVKTLERKLQKTTTKVKKVETTFVVKAKHRVSDTPSNFTVISDIEMPDIVKKLFGVAFEEMAATEVQFASRDKDGNLLDKEDGKKFESRVKHEVSNWDAFYEANRAQLLALTRTDVFQIIEFISKSNAISLDGPTNKIVAFEIFTLGYIVDAARRNVSSWNFSEGELTLIEKVYESKASAYGSGLNAVKQMLSVIDPFKRVRQRMLDDFNLEDEDLEPLFDAVEAVQGDTNPVTRKQKEVALVKELDRLEQLMLVNDRKPRTIWQQIKSLRFTFMLSSPVTSARNFTSNVIVENFNSAADTIGNIIFNKKGYRKGQWNLSKVQISDEVKDFIDNNIKNNEMFDILYEGKTKHDDRRKVISTKRSLFVNMIVSSLEEKYVTQHRFNRNKWLNGASKFVSKMISDKRFIKRASERYLGKILTLENVRLDEGLSDEVLKLFAEAVIIANEDYMHKRTAVMDAIDGLKATHPVLHETLLFWQPFLNSSINWFFETYKYTPIGLINSLVRMARFETKLENVQKRRSRGEVISSDRVTEYLLRRDVGKGFVGLALTALGIMLALSGRIRIDEEDDKFYIYAGNVKLDITQIFSSSSVLVGAAVAQVWADSRNTDYNFDDIMKLVSIQLFEGFIINDMLGRHQHNESLWESLLTEGESVLRSMVPQVVQLLVRATNNSKIRYTAGFKGIFERWLNTFIPTQPLGTRRIDPYTGKVESKYAIAFFGEMGAILGPKFFLSQISEEEKLARDYGVNKKELDAELTIDGVKIKLSSKEELNKYYGELNKSTLLTLKNQKHYVKMPDGSFNTLHWNKLSDEQRANVIDRTMIQNGSIAKIYIWTQQMNKKYYASESMWQTLKSLGITTNVYRGDKGFVE